MKKKRTKREKDRENRKTPIEKKESYRWIEGMRAAREVAEVCPTTICVCIGDSDADICDLYCEPRSTSHGEVHFLVRGCHDRKITGEHSKWLAAVRSAPCLFQCGVNVSVRTAKLSTETRKRQKSREARVAELEVRATTVTVIPDFRNGRKLPEITMNVVLAEEKTPPDDAVPIQWILATTLLINSVEQVQQIISYYSIRWQIEIFYRTLKSGCRIEERQFETLDRILN